MQIPIAAEGTESDGRAGGAEKPGDKAFAGGRTGTKATRGAQNPKPLDTHYDNIRTAMRGVFQELGLVA
jgi:hypothetical protein